MRRIHTAYTQAYQAGLEAACRAATGHARTVIADHRGRAVEIVINRRGEVYHAGSDRGWVDQGWSGGEASAEELRRAIRSIGLNARTAARLTWEPGLPLE